MREVDRQAASMVLKGDPQARRYAMANREFLGRAVGYLAGRAGIDQFLDLGTGLPNMGNVHEVAQRCQSQARTVYVDHDPAVAVHGRALLAADDRTHMLELDARDPEKIAGASAYEKISAPVVLRSEGSVRRFFSYAGARLVAPGLVPLPLWRPLSRPATGSRPRRWPSSVAWAGGHEPGTVAGRLAG
jgi:hypothetical protein